MRFVTGKLTWTRGINNMVADDVTFAKEVLNSIRRYKMQDWGDMCEEDKKMNDDAVKYHTDRIFASYKTSKGKIYIITEWDRSYTTILFANEY